MRITIAEKLRPFSHLPGTIFVLPGSSLSLEIFPALIRVKDLRGTLPVLLAEIALNVEGPVKEFTALQDLENGRLRVWGKSVAGYFRYVVKAMEDSLGIILAIEKTPEMGMMIACSGKWRTGKNVPVHRGEKVVVSENPEADRVEISFSGSNERLSLGSHKLQDWESVRRRLSFAEIFPLWHRLGRMVSEPLSNELAGTSLLLKECRQVIDAKAPEKILEQFRKLFLVGIEDVLSPRLIDTEFQGIKYQGHDLIVPQESQASALIILTEGARLIRSLFIREGSQTIDILPSLPPEFHCGRFLELACGKEGSLSMEWTKKSIRCMTFSAIENQKVAFKFSNHEKGCRLRSSYKEKGINYLPGSQIDIVAGQHYWFDNFQR